MTLTRRLAAGLSAAGVTALAALAFAGTPAGATTSESAVRPVLTTPADGYGGGAAGPGASSGPDDGRGNPGYGEESPTTPPAATTPPSATTPPAATTPPGGVSPTTVPPTGKVNTVPPGGVSPTTAGPTGGVSGGTLALTGPPLVTTITMGAVLVAGGGAAIWYTRRRRVS
jgi:hypothetical protein